MALTNYNEQRLVQQLFQAYGPDAYYLARRLWRVYGPRVLKWARERVVAAVRDLPHRGEGSSSLERNLFGPGGTFEEELSTPQYRAGDKRARVEQAEPMIVDSRTSTGYEDPQFTIGVRNASTRYGRRRRKNLRNAWYEINKEQSQIWSRMQTIFPTGFTAALGPVPAVYNDGDANNDFFPMYLMNMTSLPSARYNLGGAEYESFYPEVFFQLYRQKSTKNFNWATVPQGYHVSSDHIVATGEPGPRWAWRKVKQVGGELLGQQGLIRYRHKYFSGKFTLYPQNSLGVKWHFAIVKFPAKYDAGPPLRGWGGPTPTPTTDIYVPTPDAKTISENNMCWESFWSDKLFHPNNKDPAFLREIERKLPFTIMKHEEVFVPARDGTDQPVRILKDFFWMNDREYNTAQADDMPGVANHPVNDYTKTSGWDTEQFRKMGSPFANPEDICYLAIWCESYNAVTQEHGFPTSANVPTFDFVFQNKHVFNHDQDIRKVSDIPLPPPP